MGCLLDLVLGFLCVSIKNELFFLVASLTWKLKVEVFHARYMFLLILCFQNSGLVSQGLQFLLPLFFVLLPGGQFGVLDLTVNNLRMKFLPRIQTQNFVLDGDLYVYGTGMCICELLRIRNIKGGCRVCLFY